MKATNLSVRKTAINRADIDRIFEIPEIQDERKPNSSNLSECCHMGEAQKIYNISGKALFEILKRNDVPKRNKLLEFAECQKLVLQDTQTGILSFDAHANSLSSRLIK